MNWKDPIARAAADLRMKNDVIIEIIRKEWPADGIVYVHLKTERSTAEEWVLLDKDCTYEKAFAMILRTVERMQTQDCYGGDACGV